MLYRTISSESLTDSWTFDPRASVSASRAEAFSSSIATFSQFLDSSKNVAFSCAVRAYTANSAQSAAFLRHSFGSPSTTWPHEPIDLYPV
jgi:hypothetical protein